MRTTAAYCFHPTDENELKASLALAQNADEKCALWALIGYYADESRAISEIYKLNPKSQHLNYLLTRLVNKMEKNQDILTFESVPKYKSSVKNSLDNSAISNISSIAQAGNTSKPYLWNMVAGYLQTFAGNYTQAISCFDKAEKQLPDGQLYKDQLHLLKLIEKVSETNMMDANAENKLLDDLNWLYFQLPKSASEKFRYDKASGWIKLYISSLYKSANKIVFEQLFNPKSDFYMDNANLENLKSLLEKPNKSAFEKLATEIFPLKAGDIYEYQAVTATFNNKTDIALEYMKKAEGCNETELKGNPFNGFIKDCHDCEHAMTQKTKYSKLRLIEILKIMQDKIAKGEELYNNNLLLGNSFYNISFYGNARVFYEGKIIGEEMSSVSYLDKSLQQMLLNMDNAKYYYVQALKAATTNEQKAKCHYMLAKCERNDYYTKNGMSADSWNGNNQDDFKAWTGFVKLKTLYSGTKYYQDVIKECGYFAKYVGK